MTNKQVFTSSRDAIDLRTKQAQAWQNRQIQKKCPSLYRDYPSVARLEFQRSTPHELIELKSRNPKAERRKYFIVILFVIGLAIALEQFIPDKSPWISVSVHTAILGYLLYRYYKKIKPVIHWDQNWPSKDHLKIAEKAYTTSGRLAACLSCHYDLRNGASPTCPECGSPALVKDIIANLEQD